MEISKVLQFIQLTIRYKRKSYLSVINFKSAWNLVKKTS